MAVNFKAKTGLTDVVLGYLFFHFLFPLNVVWVCLYLYLLSRSQTFRLLREGDLGASFLVILAYAVFLLLALVLVNALFVLLSTRTGKFRLLYLEQDVTLEDGMLTQKSAESESRVTLQHVVKFAETRDRILWYLSGGVVNVYPKKGLTYDQMGELRELFHDRTSRVIPFAARFGPWIVAIVLLVLAWGLLRPEYAIRTRCGEVQAFWRGDTAVISVPVFSSATEGFRVRRMFPGLSWMLGEGRTGVVPGQTPVNHVFVVRSGQRKDFTVKGVPGGEAGVLRALGQDLLMTRAEGPKRECSRFDGWSFVLLAGEERQAALAALDQRRREKGPWKEWTLWDEAEEEEEDPDADQQYRATIPIVPSELVLGMDTHWVDRKTAIRDTVFTLKGSAPDGMVEVLLTVPGKPRRVSDDVYRSFLAGKETEPPEVEMPVETPEPPNAADTPADTPETPTSTSTATVPDVPVTGTGDLRPDEAGPGEEPVAPTPEATQVEAVPAAETVPEDTAPTPGSDTGEAVTLDVDGGTEAAGE